MNAIFLDEIPHPFNVPREPASDPDYIKHVYCDGARFHVISYSTLGRRCSEPDCIINKPIDNRGHSASTEEKVGESGG